MKKTHIAILVLVAAGIASLTFFLKDLTTYTNFATAQVMYKDTYVHVVAWLDTTATKSDSLRDANRIVFYAKDSSNLTQSTRVIYNKEKPDNFENSTRLVLKGYMRNNYFECKEIQLKCPSKYKDEAKPNVPTAPTAML